MADKPDSASSVSSTAAGKVTVQFDGSRTVGEFSHQLEAGKHVLPLGVPVEVPADLAEHLTSGENAKLYKVKVVETGEAA